MGAGYIYAQKYFPNIPNLPFNIPTKMPQLEGYGLILFAILVIFFLFRYVLYISFVAIVGFLFGPILMNHGVKQGFKLFSCSLKALLSILKVSFVRLFKYSIFLDYSFAPKNSKIKSKKTFFFFHPNYREASGGEKVLWECIYSILTLPNSNHKVVILGGASTDQSFQNTDPSQEDISPILKRVHKRFGLDLDTHSANITCFSIPGSSWILPHHYPRFTILAQSIGAMVYGVFIVDFLNKWFKSHYPESKKFEKNELYFVDSAGHSFVLPVITLYLPFITLSSYVHYPTVSSDMISDVQSQKDQFNNSSTVAKSPILTWVKTIYYKFYAKLYALAGSCNHITMANSTWTQRHLISVWGIRPENVHILYPPCNNINDFIQGVQTGNPTELTLQSTDSPDADSDSDSDSNGSPDYWQLIQNTPSYPFLLDKKPFIVSIAQFRPEKDHPLQLAVFAKFLSTLKSMTPPPKVPPKAWKLVLIGSSRNEEDIDRIDKLLELAHDLGIKDQVIVVVNAPFPLLSKFLTESAIGLHTMRNEHFGIVIAEMMSCGLLTIAHKSGGPYLDIIVYSELDTSNHSLSKGFLATDQTTYFDSLLRAATLGPLRRQEIITRAQEHSKTFTNLAFEKKFRAIMKI